MSAPPRQASASPEAALPGTRMDPGAPALAQWSDVAASGRPRSPVARPGNGSWLYPTPRRVSHSPRLPAIAAAVARNRPRLETLDVGAELPELRCQRRIEEHGDRDVESSHHTETGVGGDVDASGPVAASTAPVTATPRPPVDCRRASGVKPLTAGTPPSSRGRKAHNCSGRVTRQGRSPPHAEDARSAADTPVGPQLSDAPPRHRDPATAKLCRSQPRIRPRAAFPQPPRPCPPRSTHPHLFQGPYVDSGARFHPPPIVRTVQSTGRRHVPACRLPGGCAAPRGIGWRGIRPW